MRKFIGYSMGLFYLVANFEVTVPQYYRPTPFPTIARWTEAGCFVYFGPKSFFEFFCFYRHNFVVIREAR